MSFSISTARLRQRKLFDMLNASVTKVADSKTQGEREEENFVANEEFKII